MITELAGFTLTRTLPDKVLLGLLSREYNVFGGVIRNSAGQIVAHLVKSGAAASLATPLFPMLQMGMAAFSAYELRRIGQDIAKLMTLVKGTMVLSGLTLAVASAGFLFLNRKLEAVDSSLKSMAADTKSIRQFLELQERARLASALKVVRELHHVTDDSTKTQMLLNSRQTLGELHEKYKELITRSRTGNEFFAAEEYFTITTIGHALCSAELRLFEQAKVDLIDAHSLWKVSATSFVQEQVLGSKPERLLAKKYVPYLTADQIVSVMEFAKGSDVGLAHLDDLRSRGYGLNLLQYKALDESEINALAFTRKLIERDKILQGYADQYGQLASSQTRPSELQHFFDGLPGTSQVEGVFIFVANDYLHREGVKG